MTGLDLAVNPGCPIAGNLEWYISQLRTLAATQNVDKMGSERALDGKTGTTSVRTGMARCFDIVAANTNVLKSLA